MGLVLKISLKYEYMYVGNVILWFVCRFVCFVNFDSNILKKPATSFLTFGFSTYWMNNFWQRTGLIHLVGNLIYWMGKYPPSLRVIYLLLLILNKYYTKSHLDIM